MRLVVQLFIKSLKEQLREPLVLGGTLLMGAAFMVIFGLVMGKGLYTYPLAVLDHDRGPGSAELIRAIEQATYPDGGKLFAPRRVRSVEGIEQELQDRKLVAVVEIPTGFSAALERLAAHPPSPRFSVPITGDPANPSFNLVQVLLADTLGRQLVAHGCQKPPLGVDARYLQAKSGTAGEFTYMAPGLMLMAIMLLLIQCAMVIVKEVQAGTMLRLRLSGVATSQVLAGVSLSQVVWSALTLPLMYGTAVLMGFEGAGSLGIAFLVGLATSSTAIAFGLVTASFSRTSVEAFLWGNLVTIPVIFLSGAFFPIPDHPLVTLGGVGISALDWLPTKPAVAAMTKVLVYGRGFVDVAPDLVKMLVFSLAFFALGAFLFSRTHLRRI
jgi:ABC-2 type transport system permease protein